MKTTITLVIAFGVISLAQSQPALADAPIIVGNGTAASCTEFALQDALTTARSKGEGTIKFRCGTDPVTILVTIQTLLENDYPVTLNIPNNTTIDGGGLISLASACCGEGTVVFVDGLATVVLKNLTLISNGASYSRPFWNTGTLTMQNVTVACRNYGSCLANDGELRLHNSRLGGGRPAIGNFNVTNTAAGTLLIQNTVFSDNYGVGIWNEGVARIYSSTFQRDNGDNLGGGGGAIVNAGTLWISSTVFSENGSGVGGSIANSGTLVVKDSTFADNGASWVGGALTNSGNATIDNSRFLRNRATARYGGGAIFNSATGTLSVRNTDFFDNSAAYGGALYNQGALTITSVTLSGNSAGNGAAIANGGVLDDPRFTHSPNGGQVTIAKSTITNNVALEHGGGIYTYGTGTVDLDADTQILNNTPDDIFWAPAVSAITTSGSLTPK